MLHISDVRPIEILLVEDNPTDVLLAEEAFERAKVSNKMYVANDGIEALAFLRRERQYHAMPRPDIILLDLNMPRKNGIEVLAEIKADGDFKTIPVVILTTSKADEDILKAYGLHANCYIVKPVTFEQFAEVIKSIEHFWFNVVVLPASNLLN